MPATMSVAALLCALLVVSAPVQAGTVSGLPAERPETRLSVSSFVGTGWESAAFPRERFAQSSQSRFQQGRSTREVSDQEHAKDRRDRGHNKSFDELFQRARSVGRGEYLGVEPDISSNIYRFKFMRTSGKVVWVDMDGQTGRVIAERH